MRPIVKLGQDTEECGCLECRDIGVVVIRRSVIDALAWSFNLIRTHRSILVFAVVALLWNRAVDIGLVKFFPAYVLGIIEPLSVFVLAFFLRAYIGTLVVGELTGRPVTVYDGVIHSLRRTPALVVSLVLVVVVVMTAPFVLSLPLFFVIALIGIPLQTVVVPLVLAVGGVVFAVPFVFLLFRFWLAVEACVLGRYGPIESLRVSWQITSNHRGKLFVVVVLIFVSTLTLYFPEQLPVVREIVGASRSPLSMLLASLNELLSLLWAGVYAHVYVQAVVSESAEL